MLNIVLVEPEIPQNAAISRAPARRRGRICISQAPRVRHFLDRAVKRAGLGLLLDLVDISGVQKI